MEWYFLNKSLFKIKDFTLTYFLNRDNIMDQDGCLPEFKIAKEDE